MSKRKNRLAGLALAGVMMMSVSIPAMAADITVTGTGGAYSGYRLLDLTTSLKADHEEHEGGGHDKDCYNYSYTVPAAYRESLKSALGLGADATDAQIIKAIEDKAEDPAAVRAFADAVYALVKSGAADATASDKTFSGVDQGYWLIVETETAGDNDAISLVMLDTAGQDNITITSKEDVPKVTKKINEKNDMTGASNWQDAGDFDVGDDVEFRLTGTMPANIDAFETYKYVFHDKLSAGLTFNASSVKVTVGGQVLDAGKYQVITDGTDECSFEVAMTFDVAADGITKDTTVVVDYTAKLNENAETGVPGNDNDVFLEFSNDPYDSTKTTKTPTDKVTGFTFKLRVDKVDGEGRALTGAEFKLMKNVGGTWSDYKTLTLDGEVSSFNFFGLNAGEYRLVETKVPAGYNKADDVEFTVVAEYETESNDPQLTGLKIMQDGAVVSGDAGSGEAFEVALSDGNVVTAVVNSTGVHLPITGGAGVYMLYGMGGLAVVAGAGMMVMRKRRSGGDAEA